MSEQNRKEQIMTEKQEQKPWQMPEEKIKQLVKELTLCDDFARLSVDETVRTTCEVYSNYLHAAGLLVDEHKQELDDADRCKYCSEAENKQRIIELEKRIECGGKTIEMYQGIMDERDKLQSKLDAVARRLLALKDKYQYMREEGESDIRTVIFHLELAIGDLASNTKEE